MTTNYNILRLGGRASGGRWGGDMRCFYCRRNVVVLVVVVKRTLIVVVARIFVHRMLSEKGAEGSANEGKAV